MSTTPRERVSWPMPRGLMILLGAAAGVIVLGGLREAAGIVGPAFLSLVLTIAVHPIRGYVTGRGWPGWVSLLVGIAATYLILLAMTLALTLAVARFASLLTEYQDNLEEMAHSASETLEQLGVTQAQTDAIAGSLDVQRFVGAVGDVLAGLAGFLSGLFLVVTLLFFLGLDASHFPSKLDAQRQQRWTVVTAFESFAHGTRKYLVVATVFGLIVAVVDTVFLALTPIPAPLLWGLLAFITNYIPNIGFVIGVVPPAILGLAEGGPDLMILVIVVYSVFNFVIQSVIQPKFVGDAVGLSGSITFLSLVFWAWILGPVGALFAVPLSLFVKALLIDYDQDSVWMRPLLSGDPGEVRPPEDVGRLAEPDEVSRTE